jgi:hypothetical protein
MSNSEMHETLAEMLESRMNILGREGGKKATEDQHHLDEGSNERTYWHYGYASALKDVLAILEGAGAGAVN